LEPARIELTAPELLRELFEENYVRNAVIAVERKSITKTWKCQKQSGGNNQQDTPVESGIGLLGHAESREVF
jgi:hypothetical protein